MLIVFLVDISTNPRGVDVLTIIRHVADDIVDIYFIGVEMGSIYIYSQKVFHSHFIRIISIF